MNKTKSKVLSLVLASAMIVSSFSSLNFASAASSRETGTLNVSSNQLNGDDELFLVSRGASKTVKLSDLIGSPSIETYDHEQAGAGEYDSYNHVSGDKLVSIDKKGNLTVKKDASGKEVISITYKVEDYDRDDKEVTVKASKEITIYADKENELFLGKANDLPENQTDRTKMDRPGEIKTAAVNQAYMDVEVYYAVAAEKDSVLAVYNQAAGLTEAYTTGTGKDVKVDDKFLEMKNDKIFKGVAVQATTSDVTTSSVIRLYTTFEKEIPADAAKNVSRKEAKTAKTGNDTLKIRLGDVKFDTAGKFEKYDLDNSFTNVKVEVAKKWNADINLTSGDPKDLVSTASWEINKKNGKTYIAANTFDWEDKDYWKANKDTANAVGSYDEIVTNKSVKVLGGSVGTLDVDGKDLTVTVEDGTVGDIKAKFVDIQGGTVGTIKDRADKITMTNGKVKAIDADEAGATISGGTVSGNVVVSSLDLDAEDDDVATLLSGNVTVKNKDKVTGLTVDSSSDATVTVKGTLKSEDQGGDIKISGENVVLNVVDADYINDIIFNDFTGTIKGIAAATEQTVKLENDSKVVLSNKLIADAVDVEEDSRLQVADARIGSIDGDGRFAFPAGKLFVEDGISDDMQMEITEGLVAGALAFQSNEGSVTGSDVKGLGYTLDTKSVNKTTDKHVIKAISFAGPKFDKTDLTIAKGQTATVTVANYPDGTALPAGASIAYDVDANDDYISVTREGNVLTIKALDYNGSRTVDNKATIKAYVVDANGDELDEDKYVEASLNINVIEKQPSVVTVDTKTANVGIGAVYQYIAKSSTGAVMTATSSDTQIATVELFNAADARGYKFQVKGVAVGTATITTTDANGATATMTVNVSKVNGTLKADTTSYTFAPGKAYDVKFSTTGTTAVPVVTVNGKVVSIAPRGNGVYRVTAQNPGTAYVVAKVGDTHVSVKFVVANGAASAGVKGNNVSNLK